MIIETPRLILREIDILEGNAASVAVAEKLGSRRLRSQQGLASVTNERVGIYGQDAP